MRRDSFLRTTIEGRMEGKKTRGRPVGWPGLSCAIPGRYPAIFILTVPLTSPTLCFPDICQGQFTRIFSPRWSITQSQTKPGHLVTVETDNDVIGLDDEKGLQWVKGGSWTSWRMASLDVRTWIKGQRTKKQKKEKQKLYSIDIYQTIKQSKITWVSFKILTERHSVDRLFTCSWYVD